jgi:hypothetical protein
MTDRAIRVVPAGWYEDPADPARVRWWNGVSWTEHTNAKPGSVSPSLSTVASPDAITPTATAAPRTRREAIASEGGRTPDPRRSTTGAVWLAALLPLITLVLAIGALYLYFYVVPSPFVALIALAPYLLGLLWAVSDSRQLAARGFRAPSAAWALLTPLGYLVVRRMRVPGSGPVQLFVITAVLVIAVPAVFGLTGAARGLTVAVQVQQTAERTLVSTGRLDSVSCPPVIESVAPGTLFTCQAVATDGTPTQVWVSIDSADGRFSLAPAV